MCTKFLGLTYFADDVFALLKDTHFLSYWTVKLLGLPQGSIVREREDEMMAALTIARTLDPSGCPANSFNQSNGL